MSQTDEAGEISVKDLVVTVKKWTAYLSTKWLVLLIIGLVGGILGLLYATFQKPEYTAEITFAPENQESSRMGMYAGIAAQFGLDLGGGGGSVFEGDNLGEFLKSKMLIRKTLLTETRGRLPGKYILNAYILGHEMDKKFAKDPELKGVSFDGGFDVPSRTRDSVINKMIKDLGEHLDIQKIDKKVNIVAARVRDNNELFAKVFIEQLVSNGIQYYVDYRSRKTRENVAILQRQTDSVRSLLRGNIVDIAASSDLNVNPTRQIVRTGIQRKQLDGQVNSALYTELVKNLELSKLTLRKETPLIQIIDTPSLPLDKKKMGRLKGIIIFGFVAGFLAIIFLVMRRIIKGTDSQETTVKIVRGNQQHASV